MLLRLSKRHPKPAPVARSVIHEITRTAAYISPEQRDEMAIPSYLHGNPLIRWLMWRRYETIATLLPTAGTAALEFGCGLGLFLSELKRRFTTVYAIDLFPEYARALDLKLALSTQFIPSLDSLADNAVEAIVAADVLEHLEDELTPCLAEFMRCLKPGAVLVVSGPTESPLYRLGRIIAGFGGKGEYHHSNIDHLIDRITAAGFILEHTAKLPWRFLPCLFKVCRFRKPT